MAISIQPCLYPLPSTHRIYGFGENLPDSNQFSPFYTMPYYRPYICRLPTFFPNSERAKFKMKIDRNRFVIKLDVKNCSPDELTVKLNDDCLEIHWQPEDEDGFGPKEFYMKFKIPPDVDSGSITSSLSSEGLLTISTPPRMVDMTCEEKPPAQK
ncbi:hypothetical protein R3I94_006387 [Phoxinus phoxinus]